MNISRLEAANRIGVSYRQLIRLEEAGEIKMERFEGGLCLYDAAAVDALKARREAKRGIRPEPAILSVKRAKQLARGRK